MSAKYRQTGMNASFRIGLLVPMANYFFSRFFNTSTISTKLLERRNARRLGFFRCCAGPASLIMRNPFDTLFGFRGPSGFGGGLIDGMTFLRLKRLQQRDARASYQLKVGRISLRWCS